MLFQFCNSKGWCHAEHVGTITPYQAWLALKKLGREDYDVTKVMLMVLQSAPAECLRPMDAVPCASAGTSFQCRECLWGN